MAAEQVTYNGPDGANIGNATTVKVGFYGVTPVTQPSGAAQAAVATDAATATSPFGFTSAQANGLVATVNALRTALLNIGIIKGS